MAARSISPSGVNWQLLARVSALCALVAAALVFAPVLTCSARIFAGADTPIVASDSHQFDAVRAVGGSGGWFHSIGTGVRACFDNHPPRIAPMWQQATAGLGLVFWVVFSILARIAYRRQVRIAAARQRQARSSVRRERPSRRTGDGDGFAAVPRGQTSGGTPVGGTATPVGGLGLREPSGQTPFAADDHDPLAALDAEAARRSTPIGGERTVPSGPRRTIGAPPGRIGDTATGGRRAADAVATRTAARPEPIDRPVRTEVLSALGASSPSTPAPSADHTVRESSGGLPSLEDLTMRSDGWDVADDRWDRAPSDPGRGAEVHAPEAEPTRPTGLDRGPEAGGATMPMATASLGIGGAPELRGAHPRSTIGDSETAPLMDRPGEGDALLDADGAVLTGVTFLHPVVVGRHFAVELEGTGLMEAAHAVQLAIAVEAFSGGTTPVWGIGRTLASAGRTAPSRTGVTVTIPWREIAEPVLAVSRHEGDAAIALVMTVTSGARSTRTRAPIADRLVAEIRTPHGMPIGPRSVIVRTVSGRAIRGWVGADAPGRLVVPELEPGLVNIEFENGNFIGHPGGGLHRAVHVTTNGVAFAATGSSGEDEVHTLAALEPAVVYASTYASGTVPTGDRGAPFPSIRAALDFALSKRALGDPAFQAVEIRVDPTNRLPSARHGLASDAARSQWLRWWTGAPADVTQPWCTDDKPDLLRAAARPRDAASLAEEVHLHAVDDIRIVNSAYAGLMDRVARSPGFEIDINAELGAIPLVLCTAPASGPAASFRLEVEACARIHVEGVHFLGSAAQSGIAVRDSQNVNLRRCWIDLFASGTTARGGVFAVGRGIQVDGSGGPSSNTAVVIDMCDVGWNHAARRAVAVRGAGIAIYDSNVVISRCHVHHNVATAAPADVAAQGSSSLQGGDNHRDGNRVTLV